MNFVYKIKKILTIVILIISILFIGVIFGTRYIHDLFIYNLNRSIKKYYSKTTTIKEFTYDWGVLVGNGNHCDYATLIKTDTLVSKESCKLPNNKDFNYPHILCFTVKDGNITGYGVIDTYVYDKNNKAVDITVKYLVQDYDLTKQRYEYNQDDTINLLTAVSPELKEEIPWLKQLIAENIQTINRVLKDNSKTDLESGNYIFLFSADIKDAGYDMRCH